MNKEEIKQWVRNQIDNSIKKQDPLYMFDSCLYYNNSYIRALKLSKITGQPVNKNDFKGGEKIISFNSKDREFIYHSKIYIYMENHYSNKFFERRKFITKIINEYSEYKYYNSWQMHG